MKSKRNMLIVAIFLLALPLLGYKRTSQLAILGKAKLMIAPDITVIKVELSSVDKKYEKAINGLQKRSENLKKFLQAQGIAASYLESEIFDVKKEFKYEKGKKSCIGYRASSFLSLRFLCDNTLANKIINAIGTSNSDAEISIDFQVSKSKQEASGEKLLKLAIEDAKKKAVIIANSTNQKIAQIERINYGVDDNNESQKPLLYKSSFASASGARNSNLTITPTKIEISTEITIYWTLKKR